MVDELFRANFVERTRIYRLLNQEHDIAMACAAMMRGGLILYPTDTVWGIGCDATNAEAVARVYALKQRSDSKALITLVDSIDTVRHLYPALTGETIELLEGLEGRPTTAILPQAATLAHNLLAPDGSAGIRVTREAFSNALCRRFGKPIVSTSANISGQPAPAIFSEISPEIIAGVDYVCHTRRDDTHRSAPSIVARLNVDGTITILRK